MYPVTCLSFHGKEGMNEISGGLRSITEAPCFPTKLPVRRCWIPRVRRLKAMLPTNYFYKTGDVSVILWTEKLSVYFHRDNSHQVSDRANQILAAYFAPHFSSHSPSNYAVIIMLVITSLVIWCEEAQWKNNKRAFLYSYKIANDRVLIALKTSLKKKRRIFPAQYFEKCQHIS